MYVFIYVHDVFVSQELESIQTEAIVTVTDAMQAVTLLNIDQVKYWFYIHPLTYTTSHHICDHIQLPKFLHNNVMQFIITILQ